MSCCVNHGHALVTWNGQRQYGAQHPMSDGMGIVPNFHDEHASSIHEPSKSHKYGGGISLRHATNQNDHEKNYTCHADNPGKITQAGVDWWTLGPDDLKCP